MKQINKQFELFILLVAVIIFFHKSNTEVIVQTTQKSKGTEECQGLRFGLMMHWSIYSVTGGVWNGKNIECYNEPDSLICLNS